MKIANRKRICIICEGYEEYEYLYALKNANVFSNKYEFVLINSKSINNIFSRYTDKYQSDSYSLILIFCDTDKAPYEIYKKLKSNINDFHGKNVSNKIIIFGNPCTMQIILSHFSDIKLISQSKRINSKYINKYIGIEDYKATEEQRKKLFSKIKRKNYNIMKENISILSTNDKFVSSTNILQFLNKFESENDNWINEINETLL